MRITTGRLFSTALVATGVLLSGLAAAPAVAAGTGGVHFAFPQPPIGPAGSIPAGGKSLVHPPGHE